MGSPPFATPVFEGLVASRHEVTALVTPPDRPRGRGRVVEPSELVVRARELGVEVVQPESTKDPEFVAQLRRFEADVLVVASYGELLREEILDMCPHGALNVHGSLLPRWRGASPIQRAIIAGDAETGISIQRMVLALDAGDVLLERRIPIGPEDTAGDLFTRLADLGAEAIVAALDALADGTAKYTPQDDALVTLAPKLKKAEGDLDWSLSAAELERTVRGLTPWPGARTVLPDGRTLGVLRARALESDSELESGCLLPDAEGGASAVVRCGEGALELVEVKPAGKGAMDFAAFLRGSRPDPGARLGAAGE